MKPSKILMVFLLFRFLTTLSFAWQNLLLHRRELLFSNTKKIKVSENIFTCKNFEIELRSILKVTLILNSCGVLILHSSFILHRYNSYGIFMYRKSKDKMGLDSKRSTININCSLSIFINFNIELMKESMNFRKRKSSLFKPV